MCCTTKISLNTAGSAAFALLSFVRIHLKMLGECISSFSFLFPSTPFFFFFFYLTGVLIMYFAKNQEAYEEKKKNRLF